VVVVGQAPHDESVSIPLSEVLSVAVEDGVLGGEFAVVTAGGDRYAFACRGDLESVAAYVDEGSQAWARGYTLLDRADSRLSDASDLSEAADFEAAIDAVDEAREALADARDRLAAFGDGALAEIGSEAEELSARIAERRRAVHAAHGEHAHAAARERWERRQYDGAYDRYAEAEAAFERAQTQRTEEGVADRLERLHEEWANLKVAPVAYAEAMASEARKTDEPETAAQCWEVAMERYRDVYALDWGREQRRFDIQLEGVRERILETLASAVECRIEAARRARADAETLHAEGDAAAARERLETALAGVQRVAALVAELRQTDDEELLAQREAVAAALADIEASDAGT
jgi:hypothetical protein